MTCLPCGRVRHLLLPLAFAAALEGCGVLNPNAPNVFVQPQTVSGPCTVKKFFLLSQTAVHAEMNITGPGTCSFVAISPDIQAFPTASLLTRQAEHGQASTGLVNGGRSAGVSYTPQPGFHGMDRFTVTIESNDYAIEVAVTVS